MSIAFLHAYERGIDGFVTYILFIFSFVFFGGCLYSNEFWKTDAVCLHSF